MKVSQVVIVGRPNVGKSSLFNWLAGRRIAVVDNQPGVTRDRVTYLVHELGRYFELVDTGGIGIEDADALGPQIEEQILAAIETGDVILFVVDTQAGLVPLDQLVSQRLRYVDKPILCVANKADSESWDTSADEFYRLGRGQLIRCSTTANRHRQQLLDAIVQRLPPPDLEAPPAEPVMRMAIVGRRNVGKSTLVNTLAQAPRMIVSEVPGTTRDSVDVRFEMDKKPFVAIDTPGLRRSKSVRTNIDFYGVQRAKSSVRRADIVLLFFDATEPISKVDRQLCQYVADQFKPCIFVVNKWDLVHGEMRMQKWITYLKETFPTMGYVPIGFITARTGKNVKALINHAQMLFKQSRQRIATGQLNRLVRWALQRHEPPLYGTVRPKVYYATQIGTQPPTLVLVCNEPQAFRADYRRYLLGVLRQELSFREVPVKLYLRKRSRQDTRDEIESSPA